MRKQSNRESCAGTVIKNIIDNDLPEGAEIVDEAL
jgi:hypothetical protein